MTNKKLAVIGGIHYPLTMMRYFIEAFEARDDVDVFTYGPFTGNKIPWNNGMTLDQKYVKTPNLPLPETSMNSRVPASFVDMQVPREADLWLSIDAGWCIEGRPSKAKVFAQIQTDPHVLKERYRHYRNQYDYSFCMQTTYQDAGEIYLPYGYSSKWHYPEALPKEYDVCLIGLNYAHRADLVNKLRAAGVSVKSGIGIVFDEYRQEYNKSRIALSWSSMLDLPARFWEGLAMGLPVVTNRLPDIQHNGFVEGEHYLGFDTTAEAISQINYLLSHPLEASKMAERGYEFVKDRHSWDARVEQIMKVCGVL